MTTLPPPRQALRAEHATVRRRLAFAAALAASARIAFVLAALVALGVLLPLTPATATARLAVLGAAATVMLALAVRAFLRAAPRFEPWLEQVEQRFPSLRSWLRNALELERSPGGDTSPDLAAALRHETAHRLAAVPLASQRPPVAWRRPLITAVIAIVALGALAAVAPRATRDSWRSLWDPALAAPPVTLVVEPGSVTVTPGATLAIRARVAGSSGAPRLLGPGPQPAAVLEGGSGRDRRWRFDLPPVTSPRDYAVRVARTESPRYRIALAGEPRPVSFGIAVTPPGYARLGLQQGTSTSGDVSGLRGSRAAIEVTFDRDLESLASHGAGGARAWQAITPRRWRSELPVAGDGAYELRARAASGEGRFRYRITASDDAPPLLSVHVPERDVDLPSGQAVPFDVELQDDLGLSELRLQTRKSAGEPWRTRTLSGFAGAPREARVAAAWDAATLALLPGESATFRFEAFDNNAVGGRGRAVSAEFQLRFPSLAELYESLDQQPNAAQKALEHVAQQAREVQKSLEQLQRNPPRSPQSTTPQFERAEEMRRAMERQMELSQQIDQAAQQMQQHLDDASEREAFPRQLQEKLREMSELLKDVQSEEFKRALERMQEALRRMDRNEMEQTLPEMRSENQKLLENLQRSIELLKRLREEERMEALARRAEELAERQEALNREHERAATRDAQRAPDPADRQARPGRESATEREAQAEAAQRAEAQERAAEATRQLAAETRQSAESSEDASLQTPMEAAAEELGEQAAPQQAQASQQAQQGQNTRAQQSGQRAGESLRRAAQRMSQSARAQSQQRQQEQLAAVRRAAQDLVSLERATSQNLDSPTRGPERADRQTDLAQGVARVADSLATLSEETPFLSPKVSESLGRAMQGLSQSGKDFAGQNPMRGEQTGRAGAAALNEAVLALRDAEQSMCNQPGNGMPGQQGKPGQKMGEMARDQGQLNQRSQNLTRRLSQQLTLSAGDQAELRRLAEDQRRLRAQLEQLQQEEARAQEKKLLGRLEQTRQDMQEVEERIRAGETGADLEERQVRILSRMLDAQRSLNRRDFDPEREARRGEEVTRASAPELPADAPRADRLRSGLLKAGADRYPAQYRAFVEAYLRALSESSR